jgi:hypothetical protein
MGIPSSQLRSRSTTRIGNAFTRLVEMSAQRSIFLAPLPAVGGRYVGREMIRQPMPCDHIGWFKSDGQPICWDDKSCSVKSGFAIGNDNIVKPHQRQFLIEAGRNGAISGLLVEGTHAEVRLVVWVPWRLLETRETVIHWDDQRLVKVGSVNAEINFEWLRKVA